MKIKLPRLTPLVIVAAAVALVAPRDRSGAADTPERSPYSTQAASAADGGAGESGRVEGQRESAAPGNALLMQAAAQLERRESVTARLRHQISVSGQQLYGIGSYWQQGAGEELRVRLELQIAGQDAALLQVSNADYLWVERRLPTGRTVSGFNLRQLRAELEAGDSQIDEIKPGQANWLTSQPELTARCGGLPSLLASLGENFSFLPPQAMRLAAPPGSEPQSASVPVFAIVGHWRQAKLAALLNESGESSDEHRDEETPNPQPSTVNSIPARLPQEVLILVGQTDLFPYRIEYRRLETPISANQDGPPIPYQLSANPMVVLEFTDVAFDQAIAAGQFDYAPGDLAWDDQTAALLERLQRGRNEQVATRNAADGATLPAR